MPLSFTPSAAPLGAMSAVLIAGALSALSAGPAAATEPAAERDMRAAFSALHDDDAYHDCVAEARDAAFAKMWRDRAPLESALPEVSAAYRSCEGFAGFWNALYLAGYASPEAWIEDELAIAKRSVLAQAEIDEARRSAIAGALSNVVTDGFQESEAALATIQTARAVYIQHRYVASALAPNGDAHPEIDELAEAYAELAAAPLPEDAALDLTDADRLTAIDPSNVIRQGPAALPPREEDE